jgi:hypothetical protein
MKFLDSQIHYSVAANGVTILESRREHNSNNAISIIPAVVAPMQRSHSYGHGVGQQNGNKYININNNNDHLHVGNGNGKLKPIDQAARLALSQPLLTGGDHHEHHRHHHFKGSGTMYRPDALYTVRVWILGFKLCYCFACYIVWSCLVFLYLLQNRLDMQPSKIVLI